MTSCESTFERDGDLILVRAAVRGPLGVAPVRLVLDTGAVMTTIVPEIADAIGYSARDAFARTTIRTAIGAEHGFALRVAELGAFGFSSSDFAVQIFDLGPDIDGLLGLNFLDELNYEIRSAERRILAQRI